MEAVKILDNYKLSLTEDPIYLRILSVIYLYFKISEENIFEILPDLKNKKVVISELFKSGLVESNPDDKKLSLTIQGEKILNGFDINSIVLKEFVHDLPLNKFDRIFLDKSIEYFKPNDIYQKDLTTLLRTLTIFSKALSDDEKYKEVISKTVFIIFFHYYTFELNLSTEILFDEIKSCILDDNLISAKIKTEIVNRRNIYTDQIRYCHYGFQKSNSYHFPLALKHLKNIDDYETETFLTVLRHTNYFYHGHCDIELLNISSQFRDSISPLSALGFKNDNKLFFKLGSYFSKNLLNALVRAFLELKNMGSANEKNNILFYSKRKPSVSKKKKGAPKRTKKNK